MYYKGKSALAFLYGYRRISVRTKMYFPQTATPFMSSEEYMEILPDSVLLKYIRCFWGTKKPIKKQGNGTVSIVIPDTCVDIIYDIDYTDNRVTGGFCGIDDESFVSHDRNISGHLVSTFAIRFYAWEAYAFSEDSFRGTLNGFFDVESRFRWLDLELKKQLLEVHTLYDRIAITEQLLKKHLNDKRENVLLDNAVTNILKHKGSLSIDKLAKDVFVSSRHLERIFHEYIGISPKKLSNLIRYQFVWNEILRNPVFNIQDAVYNYGYTDQSHLMHEFKRYHTMDIRSAREYALAEIK